MVETENDIEQVKCGKRTFRVKSDWYWQNENLIEEIYLQSEDKWSDNSLSYH